MSGCKWKSDNGYRNVWFFFSEEDTNNETQCTNVKRGCFFPKEEITMQNYCQEQEPMPRLQWMSLNQFSLYMPHKWFFFHMSRQRLIEKRSLIRMSLCLQNHLLWFVLLLKEIHVLSIPRLLMVSIHLFIVEFYSGPFSNNCVEWLTLI